MELSKLLSKLSKEELDQVNQQLENEIRQME